MFVELSNTQNLKRVWINPAHIVRLDFEDLGETKSELEITTVRGSQYVRATTEHINTILKQLLESE